MVRPCRCVRRCLEWLLPALALLPGLTRGGTASPTPPPFFGDYLMDVWDTERGLPNSSVTSLAQTADGFLWIGTYNGLARFDGVRFQYFDPSSTPALRHARVRRLAVDEAGTLWINTYDGSITSWRDGAFQLAWRGSGAADSVATLLPSHQADTLFLLYNGELLHRRAGQGTEGWETLRPPGAGSGALAVRDGTGTVWYRGRDQSLSRLAPGSAGFEPAPALPGGARVLCLATDPRGRPWFGTDHGIFRWEEDQFADCTPTNGEPAVGVSFLHPASDGSVWSVANGRVRHNEGRAWKAEVEDWRGVFTGVITRLGASEDREGGLWLYHYGQGLFHVRRDGSARRLSVADGFPGDRVDCCFADREGNLWAGVDRGGLIRLRQRRFQTLQPADTGTPRAATTVCEDRQGSLWIGTYGGGLFRHQAAGIQPVPLPPAAGRGFVFSACPDRTGRLWLSAGEEDLFVRQAGAIAAAPTPVHAVKALLVDHRDRLWIGHKSGLMRLADGRLRLFGEAEGLPAVDVRALAEDLDGAVWAGTGRGTLFRVKDDQVQPIAPVPGLAEHPIWSLLADADGTLWIGTFRGGLLRLRDGKILRLTTREGLPNDVICQLLDDGAGHLWLGTQQGIARLAKAGVEAFATGQSSRSLPVTAYGRFDGLPSLECSGGYQPAAWRAADGRLLFATAKGVVSVQPGELHVNQLPPPVVIEEVLVDGRSRSPTPAAAKPGAREPAPGMPVLTLEPGQRQIELRYTGLSLSAPDKIRFRYRLEGEGLDPAWVEAGDRRSAQFNYLRPGDYLFRVSACNNDGVWNESGSALLLRMLPRFYETWWFPAVMSALAVAAAMLLVRRAAHRRFARQLEQIERQRAVERDRARIAKDIHDDLGAGLTQITLLSELARRDRPEDAPAHLQQISTTARELTRAMDEIVWAVNPHNDTLDALVTYVCKFAQDYLAVAGIRCRLDLPAELPAQSLPAELRHHLFLAVKEALHNVVKHAHATEVWLRLALAAGSFTVVLEDNGCGLPPDGGVAVTEGRLSSGHGLANLQRRLASIGGAARIQSLPGQGTRVEFSLRPGATPAPAAATLAEPPAAQPEPPVPGWQKAPA